MRAPRFPLELSVQYRPSGDSRWRTASTANISSTGVLVRVTDPPVPDTKVEFRLALPSRQRSGVHGEVAGWGRVVRVTSAAESTSPAFAVAFERYDFLSEALPH